MRSRRSATTLLCLPGRPRALTALPELIVEVKKEAFVHRQLTTKAFDGFVPEQLD